MSNGNINGYRLAPEVPTRVLISMATVVWYRDPGSDTREREPAPAVPFIEKPPQEDLLFRKLVV
jgi:hypothetical protein